MHLLEKQITFLRVNFLNRDLCIINKYAFHRCMVCYDRTIFGRYTTIQNIKTIQKNQNIVKITFKVVQIKFLAMHITNQKVSFDIFTVGNLQNIFMEHDLYLIS